MKKLNKNQIITALATLSVVGFAGLAMAAASVGLGAADNFAVLAGSFITASTPSVVSGDVGLSPAAGTLYTGLTIGMVTGTIYAVDVTGPAGGAGNNPGLLTTAKNDLVTAYNNAAGQAPTGFISADLGGQTLTQGVYKDNGAPASLAITGTLTLDGGGDPNAVFIFQSASTLTTASNSHVTLINGAQACNVFWQVGSSATLGTGTQFNGNILALSSITDNGGSTVQGRLLARNAAVTLNNTNVTKATCVSAPPASSSGTGANYYEQLPAISITKVPSPFSLPSGPGPVTFTYLVTNIGKVAMNTIWVKDNKCSPVQYVSGDTNGDGKLDLTEAWTYTCTKTVSQTETNTATTHGWGVGLGMDVYATANATVVVGQSLVPPLIHITKIPSASVLPAGGGLVTYFYSVTNPGVAPLRDVSVIDNKCTGLPGRVIGHPGDLNKNNLLDPGEIWQFTCKSNITRTTTNLATAEGTANGLTAIAFANAMVVVTAPKLPNTGLPPHGESSPWNVLMTVGILGVITTIAIVLNKRTV